MASKTPVTILQEFMVQRRDTPNYTLICNDVGTHEPLFKYSVTAVGLRAIGSGKSKKEAKHEAARLLLLQLKDRDHNSQIRTATILNEVNTCYSPYDDTIKDNAVGALQNFCCENNLQNPKYDLIRDVGPAHFKSFTYRCTVSSFKCEATARTKKQARHRCSALMLHKIKQCFSGYIDFEEDEEYIPVKQSPIIDLMKRIVHFGYPLADMFNVFTTSHYPESLKLKELISKYDSAQDIMEPFETLKVILEEFYFELDIEEMISKNDAVIINLFIIAKPAWSFIGIGKSKDDATNAAAVEAIQFLMTMSS